MHKNIAITLVRHGSMQLAPHGNCYLLAYYYLLKAGLEFFLVAFFYMHMG